MNSYVFFETAIQTISVIVYLASLLLLLNAAKKLVK